MDKYAVLGNPIAHSKSPFIHKMFAEETAQDMVYGTLLCPLDEFSKTVTEFKNQGGNGLNITVPFKEQAYRYANIRTKRAERALAVNTLKFQDDGTVLGDNTDGVGIISDFKRMGWEITGKTILILGAGGASRGTIPAILDEKPAKLMLVNRTIEKAQDIQKSYPEISVASYEDTKSDQVYDIVINATSLSLKKQLPNIDVNVLSSSTRVYDLMYTPAGTTVFLDWARKNGALDVADGLGMLVGQARESFILWRDVTPEAERVLTALRSNL